MDDAPTPQWLDTVGLHGYLLGRAPRSEADARQARKRYATLVATGRGLRLWDTALRQQIHLGDEQFVVRMQALAEAPRCAATEVPRRQRLRPGRLGDFLADSPSREQAIWRAYTEGTMTMTAIARELGLSVSRVSRQIGRVEAAAQGRS